MGESCRAVNGEIELACINAKGDMLHVAFFSSFLSFIVSILGHENALHSVGFQLSYLFFFRAHASVLVSFQGLLSGFYVLVSLLI